MRVRVVGLDDCASHQVTVLYGDSHGEAEYGDCDLVLLVGGEGLGWEAQSPSQTSHQVTPNPRPHPHPHSSQNPSTTLPLPFPHPAPTPYPYPLPLPLTPTPNVPQCVKLGKFDMDRTISFVPPDGESPP